MIELRLVPGADAAVAAFLGERGMAAVARRGELVDALRMPTLLAGDDE